MNGKECIKRLTLDHVLLTFMNVFFNVMGYNYVFFS